MVAEKLVFHEMGNRSTRRRSFPSQQGTVSTARRVDTGQEGKRLLEFTCPWDKSYVYINAS